MTKRVINEVQSFLTFMETEGNRLYTIVNVELLLIRDRDRLHRKYGQGNWRKMKGVAHIRLSNGRVCLAELHWYEAHGIGKKEIKRKRYLE